MKLVWLAVTFTTQEINSLGTSLCREVVVEAPWRLTMTLDGQGANDKEARGRRRQFHGNSLTKNRYLSSSIFCLTSTVSSLANQIQFHSLLSKLVGQRH